MELSSTSVRARGCGEVEGKLSGCFELERVN